MAAVGQKVTITTDPTLIFMVVDGPTYVAEGYTAMANPNIFVSSSPNDPVPILLLLPTGDTVYLGGSDVAASGSGGRDAPGAAWSGVPVIAYNCVGGDSLYGIVAESTVDLQLLVLRQ
jgi:hypothetical protein